MATNNRQLVFSVSTTLFIETYAFFSKDIERKNERNEPLVLAALPKTF